MVTTAVVAEIVVAGLQAATWISLVLLGVFGAQWIDAGAAAEWVALATLLVLAAAYMLGVLTDRAADVLVLWLDRLIPPRPVDKPASIHWMRLELLAQDGGISRFLDYQRSRMRVARATVLNLCLLLPALLFFLARQSNASSEGIGLVAMLTALAAVLAYRGYRRIEFAYIEFAYIERLSDAYRMLKGISQPAIAAGVCYRWKDDQLELRLVRTSDGERWTFPKGHRKRRETLPEAALRESREEAGVRRGSVDGERLTDFCYPSSRVKPDEDDEVAAFLIKVMRAEGSEELGRDPAWCSLAEAGEKLAENREQRYLDEMERVLSAAARRAELDRD